MVYKILKSLLSKPIPLSVCLLCFLTSSVSLLSSESKNSHRKSPSQTVTKKKTDVENEQTLILKKLPEIKITNLMKIGKGLYTGGLPESEDEFKRLSKLGIKTIVSVDGNRPRVELAKKHGLKYIHIPIGYDGLQKQESYSIVRVVKECEAPYYFHCHHGKHRGPASAAIACIAMKQADNKNALKILELAGTSKGYSGLWRDVKKFTLPNPNQLLPVLKEISETDSMVDAMVKISHRFDSLGKGLKIGQPNFEFSQWKKSKERDSLIEISLLLAEDFRETDRNLGSDYDSEFRKMLKDSEKQAQEIHKLLKTGKPNLSRNLFLSLKKSCNQCHQSYRN